MSSLFSSPFFPLSFTLASPRAFSFSSYRHSPRLSFLALISELSSFPPTLFRVPFFFSLAANAFSGNLRTDAHPPRPSSFQVTHRDETRKVRYMLHLDR